MLIKLWQRAGRGRAILHGVGIGRHDQPMLESRWHHDQSWQHCIDHNKEHNCLRRIPFENQPCQPHYR